MHILFLLACTVPLPHGPGQGVVRLHSDTFVADVGFDDDGNRVDDAGFVKETATAAAELGVWPGLTLHGAFPAVWIPERGFSAGDVEGGGLLSLYAGPIDLGLDVSLKAPLYRATPSIRGRSADGLPAVGDGQLDATVMAVFVAELPFDAAMDAYAGYRARFGDVSDAVVGGGRIGVWLCDRDLFLSAVLDTVITFARSSSRETVGAGYGAVGPKVSWRVVGSTFVDASALWVTRGQNTAGGYAFGLGVSSQF